MRLLRYGDEGRERPGLLADGVVRDLSGHFSDLSGEALDPDFLGSLAHDLDAAALPRVADPERLGPPIAPGGKIVCAGLNYADHAEESGMAVPAEPVLFMKGCRLTGPDDAILLPPGAVTVDWEVELAVIVGRPVLMASAAEARTAIAGYSVFCDLSERDWQMRREGQWVKGKSWPSFAPLGPWLVTADAVGDPQALPLWLDVDGARLQDSSTARMIVGAVDLVAYVSRFMRLEPGDVIATGAPAGVGMGLRPPRYLAESNTVRCGIQGLGEQTHACLAWSPE